jgi:hypothetical protein
MIAAEPTIIKSAKCQFQGRTLTSHPTRHSFKVVGDTSVRAVVLVSPPGCEKMFEELAGLPPGPPDMAKVEEICKRYGVHFL